MHFFHSTAEIFIPDGVPSEQGLARTTHLAIAAHQDDLEIMAAGPILECFQDPGRWFSGIIVTDGRGSPRNGLYAHYSDEEMRLVRLKEQRKAAIVGEFAAQIMLDYPSKTLKDPQAPQAIEDIRLILQTAQPEIVYTHNLADKHETHIAVALRVIAAIRTMPVQYRPKHLFGCEVWRDLDWMIDQDKVSFDLSDHENLQVALLGVFDSQIAGGKRYDLASMGRRRANATYFASHGVDTATGISFAMDLTPLILDPELMIEGYVLGYLERFSQDVTSRLERLI